MSERVPPKLASWLLKRCGSPFHGESLQGDLFEQYQEGRSRAWYWGQVTAAIWIAGGRLLRTLPWTGTARVLSRGLLEVAARAKSDSATVHMPRIGCGLAGGNWLEVERIIDETLGDQHLDVTVYDFPGANAAQH